MHWRRTSSSWCKQAKHATRSLVWKIQDWKMKMTLSKRTRTTASCSLEAQLPVCTLMTNHAASECSHVLGLLHCSFTKSLVPSVLLFLSPVDPPGCPWQQAPVALSLGRNLPVPRTFYTSICALSGVFVWIYLMEAEKEKTTVGCNKLHFYHRLINP